MISIKSYGNATPEQIKKLKIALEYCNLGNETLQFKGEVLKAKFTETGDTNEKIYANTQKDVEITVSFYTPSWWDRFKSWFTKKEIVASEGNGRVQFNASVFAQNTIAQLAGTLRHEGMHCAEAGNYKHDYLPTAQRPFSVPYLCGQFIEAIVEGFLSPPTSSVIKKTHDEVNV